MALLSNTDLRQACDTFASRFPGCDTCQGGAFDVECNQEFGNVWKAEYDLVMDPCNDDIKISAKGLFNEKRMNLLSIFAKDQWNTVFDFNYEYIPGQSLSRSFHWDETRFPGLDVEVFLDTGIANPSANKLSVEATVNFCATVELEQLELGMTEKLLLEGIKKFACRTQSDGHTCKFLSGTKYCAQDLHDLIFSDIDGKKRPLVNILMKAFNLNVPDVAWPITVSKELVTFECVDTQGAPVARFLVGTPDETPNMYNSGHTLVVSFLGTVLAAVGVTLSLF